MDRKLAIALLDNDYGISEGAYTKMLENDLDIDIIRAVEATDGRFYLPKGWHSDYNELRATDEED